MLKENFPDADCYRRIVDTVDIPVFVDGDTGHGGILNVRRTVKELERTGAAGMFIEGQVFPKRCGHMKGKQVIPAGEMVAKVKAAVDAPTLANNIEGGISPLLNAAELQEIGYSVVVFPVAATYAVTRAVTGLMQEIKNTGTSRGYLDRMVDFNRFNQIIGLEDLRSLESSYFKS